MSLPQTLEFLDKLISCRSESSESNLPLIGCLEAILRPLGFKCTRIPSAKQDNKCGLVARLGQSENGNLILSCHTDVVAAEAQSWTSDPFKLTRRGKRLFGRGTADMKGFISCVLAALSYCRSLTGGLVIVFSYDEELGCTGMREMLPQLANHLKGARLCIVGEPTGCEIATGHKGKVVYDAQFTGKSGHSALAPYYDNAIHAAADCVSIIRDKQEFLKMHGQQDDAYSVPYTTLHVGAISGGGAINIVPANAKLLFECRHLARETPEKIVRDIEDDLAARLPQNTERRTSFHFNKINGYPGLDTDAGIPEVRQLLAFQQSRRPLKVDYGTEAGFISKLGIPTIVCGPGSMAQGHIADEFIEESQLISYGNWLQRIFALYQISPDLAS